MNSRLLCMFLLAFVALGYAQDHAATYYTEPFSAVHPMKNTIESQWEGMKPPGLAIYGWNVTANGATFINISQADIVSSSGRHYNRTHNIMYHANGGAATLKGFHLEVADPCVFKLAQDETFRVHYHAETNGNDGKWGQYLRTETVPTLTMLDYGVASLAMPVCRKVYTPDLVCEMISARFVHLSLPFFKPGEIEEFDIIIDSPLTLINETLRSVVVTSGSECPTVSVNGVSHQPIDLRHVGTPYYEFTVRAHAADVWIMLVPKNYVHYDILEHEPYIFSVRSQRITPSGDPYIPVSQSLSGGAIFGIIIAVIAGVGIIGFALYYFRARWMPGQNSYANL